MAVDFDKAKLHTSSSVFLFREKELISQMWIIQKHNVVPSYPLLLRRNKNLGSTSTVEAVATSAKINNNTKKSSGGVKVQKLNNATKKLSLPSLLTRTVVAVFSLGFIDAGYSGDWSRIGVISAETEDFLKAAAFLVVPFCLFFCFNISDQQEEEA